VRVRRAVVALAASGSLAFTGCSTTHVQQDNPPPGGSTAYGGGLAGGEISGPKWDRAVAKVRTATALVHNTGCGFRAAGSAVAIGANQLVTNRHVVQGARRLSIETTAGATLSVTSWSVSRTDDLALLRISKPVFVDPITIADQMVVPGDLLVVMGFPLGGPFTVGRGRVTDLTSGDDTQMIEASVDILPGNSGGPLVDTHGELVGVVRAIDLENGAALAIPSSRVAEMLTAGSRAQSPCTE
jgi:S1-C subfamily serine protease